MAGYTIDMINVGQGDAFAVAHGNRYCLIDAGDRRHGAAVVNHLHVNFPDSPPDFVVLTHVDDDHISGLEAILKARILPRVVYVNDPVAAYEEAFQLLEERELLTPAGTQREASKLITASVRTQHSLIDRLRQSGVRIESATSGTVIMQSPTFSLRVISPTAPQFVSLVRRFRRDNEKAIKSILKEAASTAENASSVVVEGVYQDDQLLDRCLFTGDAGPEELRAVAQGSYNWLKISHHGSGAAFDEELMRTWNPEVVALSHGNKHGHPSPSTMNFLRENDIRIGCSSCQGTIRFRRAGAEASSGWRPVSKRCICRA